MGYTLAAFEMTQNIRYYLGYIYWYWLLHIELNSTQLSIYPRPHPTIKPFDFDNMKLLLEANMANNYSR
jgi:hypothetical protein